MYSGKLVFAQVLDHLPMHTFRRAVSRYGGNRYVKSFPCHNQFLCMAFAQLTYRESLRDIEVCLRAQRQKLYHLGIRSPVSRNTLANANKQRDWRIYAEVAQALIRIARPMYASEDLSLDIITPCSPSTHRPSTCACPCFRGSVGRCCLVVARLPPFVMHAKPWIELDSGGRRCPGFRRLDARLSPRRGAAFHRRQGRRDDVEQEQRVQGGNR